MRSLWKTRKIFEIQIAGQNLFLILFDNTKDLEQILKGRPCFFRKQLVLFDCLEKEMDQNQVRLTNFPFWLKVGPCPLECNKKDLMHVVGYTFGGILRCKGKGKIFFV